MDPEAFANLAHLARLDLPADSRPRFRASLERILAWVEELESLDLEGVSPRLHGEVATVLRDDVLEPTLPRERALQNAPAKTADGFEVPAVIEGAE